MIITTIAITITITSTTILINGNKSNANSISSSSSSSSSIIIYIYIYYVYTPPRRPSGPFRDNIVLLIIGIIYVGYIALIIIGARALRGRRGAPPPGLPRLI